MDETCCGLRASGKNQRALMNTSSKRSTLLHMTSLTRLFDCSLLVRRVLACRVSVDMAAWKNLLLCPYLSLSVGLQSRIHPMQTSVSTCRVQPDNTFCTGFRLLHSGSSKQARGKRGRIFYMSAPMYMVHLTTLAYIRMVYVYIYICICRQICLGQYTARGTTLHVDC